jgi:hypothetical protein
MAAFNIGDERVGLTERGWVAYDCCVKMAFVNFLLAFSAPGKAKPCYIVQADDPLDQRIKTAFEKRISVPMHQGSCWTSLAELPAFI